MSDMENQMSNLIDSGLQYKEDLLDEIERLKNVIRSTKNMTDADEIKDKLFQAIAPKTIIRNPQKQWNPELTAPTESEGE